jgi:3-hydroxybutyryl-CoA dehydrogenase
VTAAERGEVLLWACSSSSANRVHTYVVKIAAKLGGFDADRVRIVTDLDELARATFLVEAVIEQHDCKAALLSGLGEMARHAGTDAVLATPTSSLSIAELAAASGHTENFVGLPPVQPRPQDEAG